MNQTTPSRGPLMRFFVGVWDTMNFTRRLIFNLLFFGFVLLFLAMLLFSGGGAKPLQERTTLVIAPEGNLVEQYSSDPASRALSRAFGDKNPEVQLRDVIRALDAAKDDKRIERVVLRLDKLQAAGMVNGL